MERPTTTLHGRNLWRRDSSAALWLTDAAPDPSSRRRLAVSGIPELASSSEAEPASFADSVLALACWLHERSGQGRTDGCVDARHRVVVLASTEPEFARRCLEAAHEWLSGRGEESLVEIVARLNGIRDDECLGPSTLSIVRAGERRGVPSLRLSPVDSLVQLGWGARGRRIWAAETDASRAIPNEIAQDKELTRRLLGAAGIPVTEGAAATTREEAWSVARRLGLPVVVKPQTGSKGRGVSIGLTTEASILRAYDVAASFGQGVVVEKFVAGTHHRVLVVGGKAIAASRASEEVVVGDGASSVAALVRRANELPERAFGHASVLTRLELDSIALELLERRGMTPESVPALGEKVFLHLNGDLTTDVTERMHPEVARLCVDAAVVLGLSVTGVDLLVEDIGVPVEAQGGVVVEMNARPGLLPHLEPVEGIPRDVGAAIFETLFAPGEDGRVPTRVVVGGSGRGAVTRLFRSALAQDGRPHGAATSDGLFLGDRRLAAASSDDAEGVRRLLMHPAVLSLLSERSVEGLLREGLGLDRCDLVVVADTDAPLAEVPFLLEAAERVVVPADFSAVLSPEVAVFGPFAHPRVASALAAGAAVAAIDGPTITFRRGDESRLLAVSPEMLTVAPLPAYCAAGLALWLSGESPLALAELPQDPSARRT